MAHLELEELRAVTASASTVTSTAAAALASGIAADLSVFWQNVSGQFAANANANASAAAERSELAGFWVNKTLSAAVEEGGGVVEFPECICSDLQHDDYSPLYAWFNYIIIIIMLPSLSVFGVLTNIVNVFIFSRKRMQTSANTYLCFLACSDFMVILTGLFIFWIDSARSYITILVQAPYTTVYTLPFGYMAQTCSIYFTVAAAFDCYITVCWRRAARSYCTPRRARQINGCIVFCSILYNSLRFPQFNLRKCFHDNSQELIIEICPTTLFFTINTIYNVYLYMILMTLLPFCLLLVLNALIIIKKSIDGRRRNRKLSAERKRLRLENSNAEQSPSSPDAFAVVNGKLAKSCKFDYGEDGCENGVNAYSTPPTNHRRAEFDNTHRASISIVAAGGGGGDGGAPVRLAKGRSASCISTDSKNTAADDTLTMIMVVVLFLSCNTLALIVNVIETFFEPDALLLNLLSDTSNFLVVLNSSVNCVIYLIFNTEYRDHFLMYFLRLKQHHLFIFFFGNTKAKAQQHRQQQQQQQQQQQRHMRLCDRRQPQPQQMTRHTNAEKFLYRNIIPIQQHANNSDNYHSVTNNSKNNSNNNNNNNNNNREGSEKEYSTHADSTAERQEEEDFNYGYECCHSPIWYQPHRKQQHHHHHHHHHQQQQQQQQQRPSWSSTVVGGNSMLYEYARISKSETKLSFQPSNSETLMLMDDDSGLDESASTVAASSTTALLNNFHDGDHCDCVSSAVLPYHHATSYLAEVKILHEQVHSGDNGAYVGEMRPHIYVRPLAHDHSYANATANSHSSNSSHNKNSEKAECSDSCGISALSKLSITAL